MKLSEKYESEQFELQAQIKHVKKVVAEEKKHELNADGLLQIVRKYSNKEKLFREMEQRVKIYYKMIGQVQIPKFSCPEKSSYKKEQITC